MNGERSKLFAATLLYRWGLSQSILGAAFSALTFAGVWLLVLGPIFAQFGLGYMQTLLLLLGIVAGLFLGLGFLLDRVLKFWKSQSEVGTVRNPWLYNRLYQKEALSLVVRDLVEMRTLRGLAEHADLGPDIVRALDESITRLEETVRNRKWTVHPEENVYNDSN